MKRTVADPEWGEMIRSELDSYVPERLPARFVPRASRRRRIPRVGWRPIAVAVAVITLGFVFATVAGGPESFYRSVTQVNQSRNLTPVPTSTPTPTPERRAKVGRSAIPSSHPRSGSLSPPTPPASPASPASLASLAPVAPALAPTPALSPAQTTATPRHATVHRAPIAAPTPAAECLLGIICLDSS
jgi:hypothetical protein